MGRLTHQPIEGNRAVSTVIGVALAVGLLLLAALVWSFVLGGGQAATGSDASFSAEEQVVNAASSVGQGNVTVVDVTHDGGDALPVSKTEMALDGNTSVWGFKNSTEDIEDPNSLPQASPYPNFCATVGDSQAVVTSGETLQAVASGGEHEEIVVKGNGFDLEKPPSDERILRGVDASTSTNFESGTMASCAKKPYAMSVQRSYPRVAIGFWQGGGYKTMMAMSNVPMSGDDVQVLWEASSGEEEETLFEYTVQTDSPIADCPC